MYTVVLTEIEVACFRLMARMVVIVQLRDALSSFKDGLEAKDEEATVPNVLERILQLTDTLRHLDRTLLDASKAFVQRPGKTSAPKSALVDMPDDHFGALDTMLSLEYGDRDDNGKRIRAALPGLKKAFTAAKERWLTEKFAAQMSSEAAAC
jgi:hypothetical protein